jgi:hypothetical protein
MGHPFPKLTLFPVPCIIHHQPEEAPECFEDELLMLVGGLLERLT